MWKNINCEIKLKRACSLCGSSHGYLNAIESRYSLVIFCMTDSLVDSTKYNPSLKVYGCFIYSPPKSQTKRSDFALTAFNLFFISIGRLDLW